MVRQIFTRLAGVFGGALFVTTALLGRRLERHDLAPREAHAALALASVLLAAAAFGTGFVLLP